MRGKYDRPWRQANHHGLQPVSQPGDWALSTLGAGQVRHDHGDGDVIPPARQKGGRRVAGERIGNEDGVGLSVRPAAEQPSQRRPDLREDLQWPHGVRRHFLDDDSVLHDATLVWPPSWACVEGRGSRQAQARHAGHAAFTHGMHELQLRGVVCRGCPAIPRAILWRLHRAYECQMIHMLLPGTI